MEKSVGGKMGHVTTLVDPCLPYTIIDIYKRGEFAAEKELMISGLIHWICSNEEQGTSMRPTMHLSGHGCCENRPPTVGWSFSSAPSFSKLNELRTIHLLR